MSCFAALVRVGTCMAQERTEEKTGAREGDARIVSEHAARRADSANGPLQPTVAWRMTAIVTTHHGCQEIDELERVAALAELEVDARGHLLHVDALVVHAML